MYCVQVIYLLQNVGVIVGNLLGTRLWREETRLWSEAGGGTFDITTTSAPFIVGATLLIGSATLTVCAKNSHTTHGGAGNVVGDGLV